MRAKTKRREAAPGKGIRRAMPALHMLHKQKTASVLFIVQMPFLCVLLYCYFVPKIRSPASPRPGMM